MTKDKQLEKIQERYDAMMAQYKSLVKLQEAYAEAETLAKPKISMVGERLQHPKLGTGVILEESDTTWTVEFLSGQTKRLYKDFLYEAAMVCTSNEAYDNAMEDYHQKAKELKTTRIKLLALKHDLNVLEHQLA